ncbi:MAG: glutathione S-transferase family protein [Cyanobacteria bacterium J06635_10]
MQTQQKAFRLITIPVSHYCEKVRWVLDILKLPYVEEAHMPPFHRFATTKVGGKSVPVLVTEDGTFTDSTDILKYLDSIAPNEAKLYPLNPEEYQKVEKLEELFDEKLAPAIRQWGYFYVMNNSNLMQEKWCQNVPIVEKLLFPLVFPPMRSITNKKYNINAESAGQAYEEIKSIFEKVSRLLAGDRKYLVGDKISVADIAFASLAAPILSPEQHPTKSSKSQELPSKMLSVIKEFRKTPAGTFVLNLYANR